MIAADASRLAAVVGGGRVCERVVIRALGGQRGSGRVRERVVVRAPGRQRMQSVNPGCS